MKVPRYSHSPVQIPIDMTTWAETTPCLDIFSSAVGKLCEDEIEKGRLVVGRWVVVTAKCQLH